MALSLFHHANKLKQTHHLIVVECGCMNEFVGGRVNLIQILENIVHMFVGYPLTHVPQCHDDKVKESALHILYNCTRNVFSSLKTMVMLDMYPGYEMAITPIT